VTSAAAPRRSRNPAAVLFYDRRGELHAPRVLLLVAVAVALVGAGTFAALMFANAGRPGVLGLWIVGAFIVIKVPLLAVLWWVMGRHVERGTPAWSASETAEILAYLEREAAAAVDRPDAATRLAYYAGEAWHVADRARDEDRPEAVAAALRIDALAARHRSSSGTAPA
jgi:hypothetical protein